MARRSSKLFVIDASVASSSGEANTRGERCRRLLSCIVEVCHRMVITPEIHEEWKRHSHPFARRWQVQMYARKKVVSLEVQTYKRLCDRVLACARDERTKEAVRKDLLLIEAAVQSGGIIVSRDYAARECFSAASRHVAEIARVCWINPDTDCDRAVEWLAEGAGKPVGWSLMDYAAK